MNKLLKDIKLSVCICCLKTANCQYWISLIICKAYFSNMYLVDKLLQHSILPVCICWIYCFRTSSCQSAFLMDKLLQDIILPVCICWINCFTTTSSSASVGYSACWWVITGHYLNSGGLTRGLAGSQKNAIGSDCTDATRGGVGGCTQATSGHLDNLRPPRPL